MVNESINEMKQEIVDPDPARAIEGYRDTGYDFSIAIADIIDNSIAAEASLIEITSEMDYEGNIVIYIADNGYGMNIDGVKNAMKYGSEKRLDPSSLGKFGLGLKTASTAFCRSLSVVSRDSVESDLFKARWDLDHVINIGKWALLYPTVSKKEKDILDKIAKGSSGTLVIWEKVDRIIKKKYQEPGGRHARNAFEKLNDDLYEHVSMVYQRFLDSDDKRGDNTRIFINNKEVKAWDPFCNEEPGTEIVAEEHIPVTLPDGLESSFKVKAYVLPRKEEFSSAEEAKNARINNDNQGFYVYRENRLIHYADWLGMYIKDPHGSLLRVEFSFDHTLDEAFNVDIKKSRINLSDELYNSLKKSFLPAPRRVANKKYRKGRKNKIKNKSKDAHDESNKSIGNKEDRLVQTKVDYSEDKKDIKLTNRQGTFSIKMPINNAIKEGQLFVQPVESIDDGCLWEPCIIDKHHAVKINTGHEYYSRVYLPNYSSSVTIQGMDSLLWALCEAELIAYHDEVKDTLKEMRYEVSKLLRNLVKDLPEPELEEDDD